MFDPCTSWATVGALVDQVVPPSSEYSTLAPVSTPLSVSAGLLVMWSLPEDPLSLVSATPGAAGVTVSRVKLKAVRLETLPATSVCRTSTVFDPCTSWAIVGALVDQVVPPSSEYSTLAPGLDPAQRQRRIVGDVVAARRSAVAGQRHPGCRRGGLIDRQRLACFRGLVAGPIRHIRFDCIAAIGQRLRLRRVTVIDQALPLTTGV